MIDRIDYGRSMPSFTRDDVEIAFLDEGEGEPIVLCLLYTSRCV